MQQPVQHGAAVCLVVETGRDTVVKTGENAVVFKPALTLGSTDR